MTKTMLGDAEVMPGLGPVPLLQRQSASESRWTRPVPTSREAAFRNVRVLGLTKMKVAAGARGLQRLANDQLTRARWALRRRRAP